jgi:aubergine
MGQHEMELWPGYQTSIREHETDILMCTRITHKVMRTDTVLQLLMNMQRSGGDWQQKFMDQVLGLIVLTDYNNRTYRVDDVDFNVSPMSTFTVRGAGEITYAEYYSKVNSNNFLPYFIETGHFNILCNNVIIISEVQHPNH